MSSWLCIIAFIVVTAIVITDYKQAVYLFKKFIDWIDENPEDAVGFIILAYVITIIFMGPITQLHIAIGYTYSHVY